jgi:hypothetical protein
MPRAAHTRTFAKALGIVTKAALLLILGALSALMPAPAQAHEVLPSIAQVSVAKAGDGTPLMQIELRLNAEAFVAGIDLDGLEDTNASQKSGAYDHLRALSPADMAAQITKAWPTIASPIEIGLIGPNTTKLSLAETNLTSIDVSEIGNIELARPTRLMLQMPIPTDVTALTFTWPKGYGSLALRQTGLENGYAGYLDGGETSPDIPLSGANISSWAALWSYIPVGFDHILPKGLDHILFVLGLYFLSTRLKPLIWQVSAFTLAHTVTLALGALGWVKISPQIVEPLIAASIAVVALENIWSSQLTRWRPAIIFGFGLLHGLGFASVLQDFGLPQGQFIPALIGFNIGVELGQLTVIAIAFLCVGLWFRDRSWYRRAISIPASVVIALIGIYWVIERTLL